MAEPTKPKNIGIFVEVLSPRPGFPAMDFQIMAEAGDVVKVNQLQFPQDSPTVPDGVTDTFALPGTSKFIPGKVAVMLNGDTLTEGVEFEAVAPGFTSIKFLVPAAELPDGDDKVSFWWLEDLS